MIFLTQNKQNHGKRKATKNPCPAGSAISVDSACKISAGRFCGLTSLNAFAFLRFLRET